MRLAAKKPQALVLEQGAELDGYTVEGIDDAHAGRELRYAVTASGGERATLQLSRRAFADKQERARFRRLAGLRVGLTHPAAIEVNDFGEHAGHPYLVTEPHDAARTFGDLLADEAPLEPGRLIAMLEPVAAALDLAHGQGLVHQGLGGDSLLLSGRDRLLLDSFALFELGGESAGTTAQRADLRYLSPEQVRSEQLGPRGNVYSLAALIVHALTGQPPYSGDRLALNYAHLMEPPPALSTRTPALDPAVDAVIARALSKEPDRRPSSATQLLSLVAMALGVTAGLPAAETAPAASTPHGRRAGDAAMAERRRTTGAMAPAFPPTAVSGASASPATTPRAKPLFADTAAPDAPRRRIRLPARAAIAAAAAIAAVCGAALALAVDPFADEARTVETEPAAAVWNRLDAQRADLRAELDAAETPQEQAAIAGRLASAYDDAARTGGPGAQARRARAVRDAYASLGAAAESGNEAGYGLASAAIAQAEQQLQARR